MRVNIINLVPRGAVGDENGFGSARGGGLGKGQKVKSAEVWRGQQRRQNNGWESFRDYVSINQVSRGTAGKENGIGRARGGVPALTRLLYLYPAGVGVGMEGPPVVTMLVVIKKLLLG